MSPLQGSALELVEASDEIAIIGAAVSALQVANGCRYFVKTRCHPASGTKHVWREVRRL